jgi:ATPase subunit of ABC transporter with duplicated ATPase domains
VLHADHVSRHHGAQTVLDDVSLTVGPESRIGVVGPNGIGKSTLLRILAGLEEPDAGAVRRSPASTTVGWLPQEPDAHAGEVLRAYLARRTGVAAAEAELERLTAAMAGDPSLVEAYSEALERFLALGGDDFEARAMTVLAEVGMPADRIDVPVGALSGGQAARAALAAILLARVDVLLLDEPTNNLDFDGLDLLERFVDGAPGAIVVVSHDRAFLDRCATRIVEITEEHHRAVEYAGGWTDYLAAKALGRSQQRDAFERYSAERGRLTERAHTQRQWSERAVKTAKKKATDNDKILRKRGTERSEKQASKVRATEKAIGRLTVVEKPWEGWRLALDLGGGARSGDVVARLQGAVVERGSFTLGPVDLEIGWAERVAVLGPNGAGKSTLIGALLGTVPLVAGTRHLGPGVVVGELDQARGRFDGPATVVATMMAATTMPMDEVRSLLAKFGLGADHATRAGKDLSPGERTRAQLALLMAEGVNCLVLDEPTNHLDLPAIEQLEQAVGSFEGTLVLVTHDRRFLEQVEVTRTVSLAPGGVVVAEGAAV